MRKEFANGFFVFTRKERRGIFALLTIVAGIWILSKWIYPRLVPEPLPTEADLKKFADQLKPVPDSETVHSYKHYNSGTDEEHRVDRLPATYERFNFDPNTLSPEGWARLGLREKTIATIQHYLGKGGRFRQATDLEKIWGLSDEEKQRLVPLARIATTAVPSTFHAMPQNSTTYPAGFQRTAYEKKSPLAVDINTADSVAWVALPGIGPGFSKRILRFRDRLGGFYSVDQVAETFGLPDSVFQKIRPWLKISGEPKKININTATNDELKAHPYIRWQLAALIVSYRTQHGPFTAAEQLKNIVAIDEQTYTHLLPYVSL